MDFYTPPPNKKIIKWNGSSQDNQQMSPTRRHHKYLINLCWTLLVTCFSRTVVSLWSVLMEISLKSIVTTILRKIAETLKSLHFLPSTVPQICINAPTKHFLNDFPLASFFFFAFQFSTKGLVQFCHYSYYCWWLQTESWLCSLGVIGNCRCERAH